MADENNIEQQPSPAKEETGEKKKFNSKILIVGLPVFVVQLIAVYFITANLLLDKIPKTLPNSKSKADSTKVDESAPVKSESKELGKFIFQIEDVIVNPADTEGKRLILASIGFDVAEQKELEEFKAKEVLLKDVIVSTISSKSLLQLSNAMYKDSLKIEIFNRVKTLIPESKLNTIYISKYIIQ